MTQLAGRDKADRMARDSMNNGLLVMRASGKGFRLWFSISCAAALVGFVCGLVGLGGYGVKYARELHIPYVALLPISIGFGVIWVATFVVAVVLYRRRGLWLLAVAPVATFWPGVFALFAYAIASCVAHHPGNSGGCYP